MSRLTRDGTAEAVSRDQTLRRERGQGNIHFPCSADHDQDWQPHPVDPYSCYIYDDHTYIHIVLHLLLYGMVWCAFSSGVGVVCGTKYDTEGCARAVRKTEY